MSLAREIAERLMQRAIVPLITLGFGGAVCAMFAELMSLVQGR